MNTPIVFTDSRQPFMIIIVINKPAARITPSGRLKPVNNPEKANNKERPIEGFCSCINTNPKANVKQAIKAKNGVPKNAATYENPVPKQRYRPLINDKSIFAFQ